MYSDIFEYSSFTRVRCGQFTFINCTLLVQVKGMLPGTKIHTIHVTENMGRVDMVLQTDDGTIEWASGKFIVL